MDALTLKPRPFPGLLSIVIPCYNEEEAVPILRYEVTQFVDQSPYPCEVILVNDGSTDKTLEAAASWCSEDSRIRLLNLSRNFGHEYAATAGIDYACGDAVVLMDADLQDPLEVIHFMVDRYRCGYDVVCGQRKIRRGESVFKRLTAWFFYRAMRALFLKTLPPDVGDFRLMSRRCVDSLRSMRELHRFLRGMVAWAGYSQTCVQYERPPRIAGATKYPLRKMLRLAGTAAISFSALPLRLSFVGAAGMTIVALVEMLHALVAYIAGWTVPGWTSLMVVLCLSNAVLMVIVGILGEYVGRIYEECKGRPLYLVADAWNVSLMSAGAGSAGGHPGNAQPIFGNHVADHRRESDPDEGGTPICQSIQVSKS